MPWEYSRLNPNGRWFQDDHGIMISKLPSWLPKQIKDFIAWAQPWQRRPRINNAYKPPLPFRISKGPRVRNARHYDGAYPLAPGTPIFEQEIWHDFTGVAKTVVRPHFLADEVPKDYNGWTVFDAFLGGEWVECFHQYQRFFKVPFTNQKRRLLIYYGLKQDLTVSFFPDERIKSDMFAIYPEASVSFKKWN